MKEIAMLDKVFEAGLKKKCRTLIFISFVLKGKFFEWRLPGEGGKKDKCGHFTCLARQ